MTILLEIPFCWKVCVNLWDHFYFELSFVCNSAFIHQTLIALSARFPGVHLSFLIASWFPFGLLSLSHVMQLGNLGLMVNKAWFLVSIAEFSTVAQSCLTLWPHEPQHARPPCPSPTPGVGDAIQPSHPLSSPSPLAPNPSQHQSLFQWVNSSHDVAKVLEFQLQHQSFQWTCRTDVL